MSNRAFSLIEVLVVIGILGLLMVAASQLVVGTLDSSAIAQAQSSALSSLKDATGYLGDQVRAATRVYDSLTVDSGQCNTATTFPGTIKPCFGVLFPTLDSSGNPIANSFQIRVYQIDYRSQLDSAQKNTNAWADASTFVIREYRQTCTTSCPLNGGTVSTTGGAWYLIADQLTLTGPSGAMTPFAIFNSGTRVSVQIQVRAIANVKGRSIYTPGQNIYSVRVQARNIQ